MPQIVPRQMRNLALAPVQLALKSERLYEHSQMMINGKRFHHTTIG